MTVMTVPLTDDWIIERFVRFAKPGEGGDVYEPWPGYDKAMTKEAAEKALDECIQRWPDYEFRAHRVRVHEKMASELFARLRCKTNE